MDSKEETTVGMPEGVKERGKLLLKLVGNKKKTMTKRFLVRAVVTVQRELAKSIEEHINDSSINSLSSFQLHTPLHRLHVGAIYT